MSNRLLIPILEPTLPFHVSLSSPLLNCVLDCLTWVATDLCICSCQAGFIIPFSPPSLDSPDTFFFSLPTFVGSNPLY